MLKGHISNIFH